MMDRRLSQLERDTTAIMANRLKQVVERDPEVQALLRRWDAAAYAIEEELPVDYRPDPVALDHLRRESPHVEVGLLAEMLWRRDRARRDDPALDADLTVIETRVEREVRDWR